MESHDARRQSWFLPRDRRKRPSWRAKAASAGRPSPRRPESSRLGREEGRAATSGPPCGTACGSPPGRCSSWRWSPASSSGSLWTPLRTPVLVAVVTDCESPLPPNAWAQEDAERLQILDRQEVLKCSHGPWESKELGVAELRRQLEAAEPGGPHKDLVVLYLSMPGRRRRPGRAVPDSARRLALEERPMAARPRPARTSSFPKDRSAKPPAEVKKLLILDADPHGQRLEPRAAVQRLCRAAASRVCKK